MEDEKITSFKVPNRDTYIDNYTLCRKEVLQKAYIDFIGKEVNVTGRWAKLKEVRITEDFITLVLE